MADAAAVEILAVEKRFGSVTALDRVSLKIKDQEFFTLLGPSGCGKTTLLRIIAGFESVTAGRIFLFGEEIEDLPPNRRSVNTVFQHYALFPPMTVAENVAFGLKRLKRDRQDVERRVKEMLELVQLSHLADRKPAQLSGGQQQRVALARALAPAPKLLLLDEPLSALDLKLRQQMRWELKRIQEETGITFIFVTHDQEEALTMSDRLAVMSDGQVQQIGTAKEIYEAPRNRFVADFIGETNLLDVTVKGQENGLAICEGPDGVSFAVVPEREPVPGSAGHISIRPEHIRVTKLNGGNFTGFVERLVYLGTDTQHLIRLKDGTQVIARTQNEMGADESFGPGDEVELSVKPGVGRLLVD